MTASDNAMIKLVIESGALSVWDRDKGPVYWYAAGTPGPFYLNTEQMVGRELAAELLDKITKIIESCNDPATRSKQVETLILAAYESKTVYRAIISALVAKAKEVFPERSFMVISGGERRDWLFSIPFAKSLGLRHLYLFKDQSQFCKGGLEKGARVLHVADLINNAASYFDNWLPILSRSEAICAGTVAINTRGTAGLNRLQEAGFTVATLNHVDVNFFDDCLRQGLIDQSTRDEIALFFRSNKEWASRYLMDRADLFDVTGLDVKSLSRLRSFFSKDPWGLRPQHEAFFKMMLAKI
jgi:hypothetical protein